MTQIYNRNSINSIETLMDELLYEQLDPSSNEYVSKAQQLLNALRSNNSKNIYRDNITRKLCDIIKKSIEPKPITVDENTLAGLHFYLGKLYSHFNNYSDAIKEFNEAGKRYEWNSYINIESTRIEMDTGNIDQVKQKLDSIRHIEENQVLINIRYARYYYYIGQINNAIQYINDCFSIIDKELKNRNKTKYNRRIEELKKDLIDTIECALELYFLIGDEKKIIECVNKIQESYIKKEFISWNDIS